MSLTDEQINAVRRAEGIKEAGKNLDQHQRIMKKFHETFEKLDDREVASNYFVSASYRPGRTTVLFDIESSELIQILNARGEKLKAELEAQ